MYAAILWHSSMTVSLSATCLSAVPWLTLKYRPQVYWLIFDSCIWRRPQKLQYVTWKSPVWLYAVHGLASKRPNSSQQMGCLIIINHHQPHHTILMRRAMMIMTGTTISTMNPINGKNNYTCSLILPYTSIYSIMMYHLISLYLLSFVHHSPSLTTHQSFHHPIAQAQRQPWPPWRCSPDDQNQARKKGRFIRYRWYRYMYVFSFHALSMF